MDGNTAQTVDQYAAGEEVVVDVAFPVSVAAYRLRSAVALRPWDTAPGRVPKVVYGGAPGISVSGDGKTVTVGLTSDDSARLLGPGVWAWCLWRTDAGQEKCLARIRLIL